MGVIVTEAADLVDRRLATVDQVKTRLGITSSSDDDMITEIIDEASALIVDYIGSSLATQTYEETIAGTGTTRILLSNAPIESISSVTYDGVAVTDYSIANQRVGVLYREDGWTRSTQSFSRLVFDPHVQLDKQNWVFTYRAGYVTPPGESGDESQGLFELPLSFRSIVIRLCSWMYSVRVSESAGLKKIVVGGDDGFTEEYFSPQEASSGSGIPPSIEKQLNPWKQLV